MKIAFCTGAFRWATGFAAGVMLFFTFGVALRIFKLMPREMAGALTQQLFPCYFAFIIAALLIALASSIPLWNTHIYNRIAAGLIAFALVCVLSVAWWLGPEMVRALKPDTMPLFRKLHGISQGINLLAMITTFLAPVFIRREVS